MSSSGHYGNIIHNYFISRKKRFSNMQGYKFGTMVNFDNAKGIGSAEDYEGVKYVVHYKNMTRIKFKILEKGQQIHFKPGVYKQSRTAEDVAIVH